MKSFTNILVTLTYYGQNALISLAACANMSISLSIGTTMSLSGVCKPTVKWRHFCSSENLSICNACVRIAWIWFHCLMSVSTLDEKTYSQEMAEAWIGK